MILRINLYGTKTYVDLYNWYRDKNVRYFGFNEFEVEEFIEKCKTELNGNLVPKYKKDGTLGFWDYIEFDSEEAWLAARLKI